MYIAEMLVFRETDLICIFATYIGLPFHRTLYKGFPYIGSLDDFKYHIFLII